MVKDEENGKNIVKDALQDTMKEISVMKQLEHVNTIRLHEVIDEENGDKIYLSKYTYLL